MGAFGSCLGVGRPQKSGVNPRLLGSAGPLVNVDPNSSPFCNPQPGAAPGRQMMRGPARPPPNSYLSQNNNCNPNNNNSANILLSPSATSASSNTKTGLQMPKLLRQTSSLSGGGGGIQQQPLPYNAHQSPTGQHIVPPPPPAPKLVDIDENSMSSSAFNADLTIKTQSQQSANNNNTSSHLICNNNNNNITGKQIANILSNNNNNNNNNNNVESNSSADALFLQGLGNPNEIRVFVAMFDYEPRTTEDLGFRKGDHLETTSRLMRGEWWIARSKATKKHGYIPSNYVNELKCSLDSEPWYFGKIGRSEAEAQLEASDNKDGAFMIRDSDTKGSHLYSLSLKHQGAIKHYRIFEGEKGGYYINKRTELSTIHDLVVHYSRSPEGLCINLRKACLYNRFDRPTTMGLSYDTCDKWEVDRNKLTILSELGRGQFGQVYEGLFNNRERVAIKTLRKGTMDTKDFLGEANIMKKMRHENLVQLYAVCTKEEPIYIITELMSKGALIGYLQSDEGKNLPLKEYIRMATQIAAGMFFIESESYVHRDLAARNILVGDNNVCKIADFGLARFIQENEYEAKVGAKFPIKWTAPEAANHSKFTIKSDVWSFGIVLYEIITKGGQPYPDMNNYEVLERIEKGYRMPQPANCENKYYSIMVECWHKEPLCRPTFDCLHWKLNGYFDPEEQYKEASLVNGSQFSKR